MADALGKKVAKDGIKLERAVMVKGRRIKTKWVDPDNLGEYDVFEEDHHWDDDLYINGNIFLGNYANSLDLREEAEKSEDKLVPSQKFKVGMETSIIDDLYGSGRSKKLIKLVALGILANIGIGVSVMWILIQGGML